MSEVRLYIMHETGNSNRIKPATVE